MRYLFLLYLLENMNTHLKRYVCDLFNQMIEGL